MVLLSFSLSLSLLLLAWLARVEAVQQNAYFIKSNNTFVIDGNPSDWDSITTTHPILDQYGNTISLFRVAYTPDSLYFFVSVVDASPLENSGNRGAFQQLFYTGDALSICFGPFGSAGTNQRIIVAPIEEGTQNVIYVMRPTWPQDPTAHPYDYYTQAEGTYHVDWDYYVTDNGTAVALNKTSSGWTAEIALPWSVLGYVATDNDLLPFDLEIISSNSLGTAIVAANWWYSHGAPNSVVDIVGQAMLYPYLWGMALLSPVDVGPQVPPQPALDPAFIPRGIPITFEVPDSGLAVSVNIIEADSEWVINDLVRAKVMNKGPITVYWNGRDRENKIVWGQTNYRARVAIFSPLEALFAASLGDSGRPGWVTENGLGSLGGIHFGPKYVTIANNVDATSGVTDDVIFCGSYDEGIPGIRRLNTTYWTEWVQPLGIFENAQGVATEDDVFCYTAMNYPANSPLIGQCFNSTTGNYINGMTVTIYGAAKDNGMGNASMALCGGKLIYADAVTGTLRINQFVNNNWTEQVNISVPGLGATCRFDADTALLVFSTGVYTFDANTFKISQSPIISGHQSLVACTVDQNDNVYVSETGAVNQVFKYNTKGALVQTYGTYGGRENRSVPYDPLAFRNIYSMAISPSGILYLVERYIAPFRIIFLNATSGSWIRDYYGPVGYTTNIVDLDDSSVIYYVNPVSSAYDPSFVEVKINYEQYQAEPYYAEYGYNVTAIHYLSQNGVNNSVMLNGGIDILAEGCDIASGYSTGAIFTHENNGFRYMYISPYHHRGTCFLKWENTTQIWYPVAFLNGSNWAWSDFNNNHLVDEPEFYPILKNQRYNPQWDQCDRNLNLYGPATILKPTSTDANGIPSFNGSVLTEFFNDMLTMEIYVPTGLQSYGLVSTVSEDLSYFYLAANIGPCSNQGFWDRASDARVMKLENGTIQWAIGHRDYSMVETGDITILFPMSNEVDGVFFISDVDSEFQAYTSDGITLGWLLKDPVTGLVPTYGPNSITIENAGQPYFLKDPVTGKRLLVSITTGDVRVLEVVGPFDDAITRQNLNLSLPNPWPRDPSDDDDVLTKKAYALNYITMGDGSDATFYGPQNQYYGDGYDYEWQSVVPSIMVFDEVTNPSNPLVVAELRLRRDAGQLCIFADVLDEAANFPFFPSNSSNFNVLSLFGSQGVEILIGPAHNNRTQPEAGDTRIFLSGLYQGNSTYLGVALAIKPTSESVNGTPEFRTQNNFGKYVGEPLANNTELDYTQLALIPGATVAIVPRTDKQGYRLEAYLPLALLTEITSVQQVQYRRTNVTGTGTGTVWLWFNDSRSDFSSLPFSFNVAIYRPGTGNQITRYPWIEDDFTGTNPAVMNPSLWGAIARQPNVNIMTLGSAGVSEPLLYQSTLTGFQGTPFTPPFGYGYTPAVSTNGFFGGGWYKPLSAPRYALLTSPVPIDGFSLEYVSGDSGENAEEMNPWWVPPDWDSSNLFMPFQPSDVASELVAGNSSTMDSVTMVINLYTNFPQGVSGVLHILYGQQGGDTYWDAYLNVTDVPSGLVISGLMPNYTDLRFPPGYHQDDTDAHESTFLVQGKSTISIGMTRNTPYKVKYAYITAVWVEMWSPPFFTSPASIPLYTIAYGQDSTVQKIQILNGTSVIGTTTTGSTFMWTNVPSGVYDISAIAYDQYQSSNPTSVIVTVHGPTVLSAYPANTSSIVASSVQIVLQISTVGPNAVASVSLNGTTPSGTHFSYDLSQPSSGGNYTSPSIDLTPGVATYFVRAVDSVGAYIEQAYTFTVASSLEELEKNKNKINSNKQVKMHIL